MVLAFFKRIIDVHRERLDKGMLDSPINMPEILLEFFTANGYRDIGKIVYRLANVVDNAKDEAWRRALKERETVSESEIRDIATKMYKTVFENAEEALESLGARIHYENGCYYTDQDSDEAVRLCKRYASDEVISRLYDVFACTYADCLVLQDRARHEDFVLIYTFRGEYVIAFNKRSDVSDMFKAFAVERDCDVISIGKEMIARCDVRKVDFDEIMRRLKAAILQSTAEPKDIERVVQEIKIREFEKLLAR